MPWAWQTCFQKKLPTHPTSSLSTQRLSFQSGATTSRGWIHWPRCPSRSTEHRLFQARQHSTMCQSSCRPYAGCDREYLWQVFVLYVYDDSLLNISNVRAGSGTVWADMPWLAWNHTATYFLRNTIRVCCRTNVSQCIPDYLKTSATAPEAICQPGSAWNYRDTHRNPQTF